jgi:hypothetical protein
LMKSALPTGGFSLLAMKPPNLSILHRRRTHRRHIARGQSIRGFLATADPSRMWGGGSSVITNCFHLDWSITLVLLTCALLELRTAFWLQ